MSGTTTITKVEFLSFSGGVTVNVNGAGASTSAADASLPTIRLVGATNANYSTIGAAVTAASEIVADIIVIAPGVYTEEVAISKSLSLYGTQGYVNAPTSYANTNNGTVLRAVDADPAISVTGTANVPVYGLSIVSSAAATGTGVSLNGASVNVDFTNSQISGFATGILAANGAAIDSTFANGVLTSNTKSISNTGSGTFIAGGASETVRNWWGQTASPVAAVSANVTYDAWIGKGDTTIVSVTQSTSLIAVQAINAAGFGTNLVAATDLTGVTAPANTTTTITATGGRKRFSGGSPALTVAANATVTLTGSPIQLDMTTYDGSSYGNVSDPTIQLATNASLTFSTTVDIFATSAAGAWSAFEFLAGPGQSVSVTGGNTVSIVIPAGSQELFIQNLGTSNLDFTGFTFYVGTPQGMSYDEAVYNFTGNFGAYAGMTFDLLVKNSAESFTIEDSVYHKLDNAAVGLVTWNANNVYVTQNSGSIQRGVDAVSANGTVNIQGANTAGFVYDAFEVNKRVTLVGSNTGTQVTNPTAANITLNSSANVSGSAGITSGNVTAYNYSGSLTQGQALAANGGTIYLPAGQTYEQQLTVTNTLTLQATNWDASGQGAAVNAPVFDGANISFGAAITSSTGGDVTIRGVAFTGWGADLASPAVFANGGKATAENIYVDATGGLYGLLSQTNNASLVVTNSVIVNGDRGIGAVGGATLTVSGSNISGTAGAAVYVASSTATLTQNVLSGNLGYGVDVGGSTANVTITGNDLSGNAVKAVRNTTRTASTVVNASNNWWGSVVATSVNASVLSTGTPNRVDITPYLLSGSDTNVSAPGFQGDFSQLAVTTLGNQSGATGRIQEGVNSIANGSLTGIDRLLAVNDGTYAGANVNQSLTLAAQSLTLNSALTLSSPTKISADLTSVGGSAGTSTTLNVSSGNLAVDAATTFTGSGTLNLQSATGSITGSGEITSGTLNLAAPAGSITASTNVSSLTANASTGVAITETSDITLTSVTTSTGNANVTAGGSITATKVVATAGSVRLDATGAIEAVNVSGGTNATLQATGAINVTRVAATNTANLSGGSLNMSGTTSAATVLLSGTTGIAGSGAINATTVSATSASGNVSLSGLNTTAFSGSALGDVTITDLGSLNLGPVTSTTGDVNVTVGTTLNVTGAVAATAGDVAYKAGSVVLTSTTSGGDVIINATSGGISGAGLVTSTGLLTAKAPAGSISMNTAAAAIEANASTGITVTEADAITLTTVKTASGGVSVTSAAGAITVGTNVEATAGNVTLQGTSLTLTGTTTATAGSVLLTATTGGITGAGLVTGNAATISASLGTIDVATNVSS
ncbi:MAG: right-handed parallel beta-helix repeat-containing protein, partial [Planctomycetota bacterium]